MSEFKIAWSPIYYYQLPENHRFPMEKYQPLPQQLMYEGTMDESCFFEPAELSEKWILKTHDACYWEKLKFGKLDRKEERAIGFPFSKRLVKRERVIAQGTIDISLWALEYGIGFNIAGGTHHAFSDRGEGFCLLNDNAIAINYLLELDLVEKILIVDLDVHQGNGTAELFKNENRVFTFSAHGKHNYPLQKERSDLDLEFENGTLDEEYLERVSLELELLFKKVEPDIVFYLSGVDVLGTDKLGKLGLTINGCKRRDELVFNFCLKDEVPIVVTMGGGYSPKIADIVEAHSNTFRLARQLYF